jgi:hypothetical protein
MSEGRFRRPGAAVDAITGRHPGLKKPSLKRYGWSRLHADILDDSRWCLVARRARAALPLVEALVIRLEAHANRSDPRGYVGDFNAAAMAARWGVEAATVLRVFTELERPDVGWIDQDQVVTFWLRNPDSDQDTTAADRQRRKRERDRAMKAAILAGAHPITPIVRKPLSALERKRRQRQRASTADATLQAVDLAQGVTNRSDVTKCHGEVTADATLQTLDVAQGVTKNVTSSVTGHASRDASVTEKAASFPELDLSHRDSVTSRPEQSRLIGTGVTVLAANLAPIDPAAFADRAQALQWLKGDGEALVMRRLGVMRSKACKAIERWSVTACHDVSSLARIVHASLTTNAQGEAFRKLVEDQVARRAAELVAPTLPLPPVAVRGRKP